MKINIIKTGSKGNAILFCGSVLIDVGIAYKYLKEFASDIKVVLLSHKHSDHFNVSSIRKLYISNESIKYCCGEFLYQDLLNIGLPEKNIIIIERGETYKIDDVTFSPVSLYHDVPNFGYRIIENGRKHFHATDTFTLDGISAKNYDSATLEANHEINAALKIIEQKKIAGEFCHLERAINTHLDVNKAIEFIKRNSIKKIYPIHMGDSTKSSVIDALDIFETNNSEYGVK